MLKKDNVYAREDEKFVKTLVLYADSSKVLFYDQAAKTDKVLNTDLEELFKKGVTVSYSDKLHAPVCCSESGLIAYDETASAITFTGSEAE